VAEQYRKPYLESSVFIAWIKGESIPQTDAEGKEIGRENRAEIAKHILSLAEAGQFHVYTSSITITEVHKGNSSKPAKAGGAETIDFFRNGFFKIIDVDRTIAESANRLCRSHRLKPYDAVHLACALRAGCDVLLTWDSDLLNITHDGITISKPQAFGQAVLDLSVLPETVPPMVATLLDEDHEPGENEGDASVPFATKSDNTGAPEGLAHHADLPANEEGKTQDDATPQNGSTVAEEPAESGGDVPGGTKAESVGDLRVKTR
jgi:predicted nucleic acid-binding protein